MGCFLHADWLSPRFLVEIYEWREYMFYQCFQVEFSSISPYSHIQIVMWIFAIIVSPNNLPKPQRSV